MFFISEISYFKLSFNKLPETESYTQNKTRRDSVMSSSSIKFKSNLRYEVNDNPSLATKILLGLQHIFAAFGGIIAVPLVI